MRINGTITHAAPKVVSAPVIVPSWWRIIAHCTTKQTSATVATDRPIRTLESHVSNNLALDCGNSVINWRAARQEYGRRTRRRWLATRRL
jgi:hypothetical protein